MAQTLFVFRPVAPPAPTAPPPGYTKAKADAVFNSSFKRFTSTPQALAVYRGRPLVIYFWATWCVPCREETRMLAALQGRHSADELTVLGIGIDQSDKLER
ncbi:MAG: TlpA family protein disulfide reductase, partial [Methylibium sp.]|nr:TlpA family protein disulfide reductase [Methylibium sp.]